MGDVRRRRVLAAGVAALVVLAVAVLVARASGGGGNDAIATKAAALVPRSALVYVHVNTRRGQAAQRLAESFKSWARLRDSALRRLSVRGDAADVKPWLGDEAALALTDSTTGTAGSLILLSVRDEAKAKAFVARAGRGSGPSQRYRGTTVARYGTVVAAFTGGFLALGQADTVRQAIDLASDGDAKSLATDATFVKAAKGLPGDRAADLFSTEGGLRRLLAPAGGVLGAAGTLLDRPGLQGTALALTAEAPGARIRIHSIAKPPTNAQAFAPFEPTLEDAIPKGALAALNIKGVDRAGGRLLQTAGTTGFAGLATAARKALGNATVASVQKDLLATLRNEAALVVLPGVPAPTVVLISKAADETATRDALNRLVDGLPKLVRGSKVVRRGDVSTVTLRGGVVLRTGVFDGHLVVSTSDAGIAAARDPQGGIGSLDAFKTVVGDTSRTLSSVVFLDFSKLLELAEQTGLNGSSAYRAVKPDLDRVKSVGATSGGSGGDTTAEILLSIP